MNIIFVGSRSLLEPFCLFGGTCGIGLTCMDCHLVIGIVQVQNSKGHNLQCSHYMPYMMPEDTPLPCVVYCHGNR